MSLFIPLILFLFIFNVSERQKMNILILLKTFLNFSSPVYLKVPLVVLVLESGETNNLVLTSFECQKISRKANQENSKKYV